ncbi:MAG: hypothetical protein C0596_01420, partial [Marinilabiliales bacterium]
MLVKTKASTSETASLGDFVEPIQVSLNLGTASIDYPDFLCNSGIAEVTLSGVQGGSFSSSPAGLVIDPISGQIDLTNSNPGTYTVTYDFVTNTCPSSSNTMVTVNPEPTIPVGVIATPNEVCAEYTGQVVLSLISSKSQKFDIESNKKLETKLEMKSVESLVWFDDVCGGNVIGVGNSISIDAPNVTTTYYAAFQNDCGISECVEVTVVVGSDLTASASADLQVSCFDASDATLTVVATGGTGAYTYILNGGTPQLSNVFENLSSGNYTVEVVDEMGCSVLTNEVMIANPDLLEASASADLQVSCYDASDATLTIVATGGTGAYTYILNGGTPQLSNVFENLSAGNYTVEVIDEMGCSVLTNEVMIANPDLLEASASADLQVSCFDASDATLTVV